MLGPGDAEIYLPLSLNSRSSQSGGEMGVNDDDLEGKGFHREVGECYACTEGG